MKTNSQSKADEGKGVEDKIIELMNETEQTYLMYDSNRIGFRSYLRVKQGNIQKIQDLCKAHYKAEALLIIERLTRKDPEGKDTCTVGYTRGYNSALDVVFAKLREGI